jgi:hypothetical protein
VLVIQENLTSFKSRKVNKTDSVMDLLSSVSIGLNTVPKAKAILHFKMYPTCTFYILLTNPENFLMVIISLKSFQAECIMKTKEVK